MTDIPTEDDEEASEDGEAIDIPDELVEEIAEKVAADEEDAHKYEIQLLGFEAEPIDVNFEYDQIHRYEAIRGVDTVIRFFFENIGEEPFPGGHVTNFEISENYGTLSALGRSFDDEPIEAIDPGDVVEFEMQMTGFRASGPTSVELELSAEDGHSVALYNPDKERYDNDKAFDIISVLDRESIDLIEEVQAIRKELEEMKDE